jgi:hypothetical protein
VFAISLVVAAGALRWAVFVAVCVPPPAVGTVATAFGVDDAFLTCFAVVAAGVFAPGAAAGAVGVAEVDVEVEPALELPQPAITNASNTPAIATDAIVESLRCFASTGVNRLSRTVGLSGGLSGGRPPLTLQTQTASDTS